MLLFIFAGFLVGFSLSLRFVRRPRRALIWGLVLGAAPLALMLGPGNAPFEGIGSVLNFAFFALGPLMLIPFVTSGAALGVAGGAAVLWVGQGRAGWVRWAAGLALVGIVATLTLLPVAQREAAKRRSSKTAMLVPRRLGARISMAHWLDIRSLFRPARACLCLMIAPRGAKPGPLAARPA